MYEIDKIKELADITNSEFFSLVNKESIDDFEHLSDTLKPIIYEELLNKIKDSFSKYCGKAKPLLDGQLTKIGRRIEGIHNKTYWNYINGSPADLDIMIKIAQEFKIEVEKKRELLQEL